MKNLLVAVDLKPTDQKLLEQAAILAKKFEAKIWLLHIADPDPDFVGYGIGPKYIRDFRADELRHDHVLLQSFVGDLHHKSIEAEGLLIQGPTVEMIFEEVEKLQIDMLILGSHKHSFLYQTFIGHTAVKIIGNITIPLLIVPLPDESQN
jgi:nucleotide-binding universal stress UspA family protein